jgi:beta-barrel assembly-enhancing protease
MSSRFSWKELLILSGGLLVLGGVSWGVVELLTPPVHEVLAPEKWDLALKKLVRGQLENALNASEVRKPKTQAALRVLQQRLENALPTPLPYPLDIVVVSDPEVNAFTFPGGLIVVNQGLLEHAADPEEVAAVLAHEMGHVVHHDPSDSLKRGLLLASLAALTSDSGAVRAAIQTLSRNAFSRNVEDRADEFAFDLLARARIKPSRFADFLSSLPETPQGRFVQKNLPYLTDHPSRMLRIDKARRAPFFGVEEPLAVDWAAVKAELAAQE